MTEIKKPANRKWKALWGCAIYSLVFISLCAWCKELIELWPIASAVVVVFAGYLGVNVAQKYVEKKK